MVSRSARFSPARRRARYGPAQGGSGGRWASASSVRRPGFKPRTHDWASSVVPVTPRIRQNSRDGMYVGGRYASPCLFYLFFRLLFSSAPFFPRCQGTGELLHSRPAVHVHTYVRVPTRLVSATFYLQPRSDRRGCTRASSFRDGATRAHVSIFWGLRSQRDEYRGAGMSYLLRSYKQVSSFLF